MSDKSFAFKGNVPTSIALAAPAGTKSGSAAVQGASLPLTVQNIAPQAKTGRLSIQAASPTKAEWFSFEGAPPTSPRERDLDFEAGATQTVTVVLAVPPNTPAADCVFKVRVSAERDPDNDFTESPAVGFKVAATAPPPVAPPKPFPWWIIAVVAAVLVAGGVAAYFLWPTPAKPPADIAVPDVVNQQAADGVKTLSAAGFVVDGSASANEQSKADGLIVDQNPKPPATLPRQSTVSVTINHHVAIPCFRLPGGCIIRNPGDVAKFISGLAAARKEAEPHDAPKTK